MENIKEWLENEYLIKKRTCNDIAKELKKDPKTIWSWLKKYKIQTRPRGGESSSGSFKKGSSIWVGKKHSLETKEKMRQNRLNDGHVPYLKDGVHWLKNINTENHPNYKGGLTPERQSFYSSQIWSDIVKQVWKRDKAICQMCGKNHNEENNRGNFHIHHIISFQITEFRSNLSNLILLCKECHLFIHSKKNINKKYIKNYEKC